MDFSKLHFAVDGDSITAGEQWSYYASEELGTASHYNVAVGSATWHKKTYSSPAGEITTQDYHDKAFAGISDGWLETEDPVELQKRANNCAVVHIQRYLDDVAQKKAPVPDIFAFAMGTNDWEDSLGDADKALEGKTLEGNQAINLYTEAGAARWCIQRIMEAFPQCRVFVLTPIQTGRPEHNKKNAQTVDILQKVAGGLCAQVINCFQNSGISEKFETTDAPGRYLKDGLHPDVPGQRLMGRYAAKEIRNNMF